MSDAFKIFALCIVSLILITILRNTNEKMSVMLKLCITVALFGFCISRLLPVMTYINDLFEKSSIRSYASLLIKALCISVVSHICALTCRDAGEGGIAYFAELVGKIQILILSLPLIDEILVAAYGLLEFV